MRKDWSKICCTSPWSEKEHVTESCWFFIKSPLSLLSLLYAYIALILHVLYSVKQLHQIKSSHRNITTLYRCSCIEEFFVIFAQPPDDRDITGRPGKAVITPQMPYFTYIAGFLPSLWEIVRKYHYPPRCHRASFCQSESKTSVSRSGKLPSSRGSYVAVHAGFVPVIPHIPLSSSSRSRRKTCPSNNHEKT